MKRPDLDARMVYKCRWCNVSAPIDASHEEFWESHKAVHADKFAGHSSGLVWDSSRIQETADLAHKTVIDFLESFADGPDSMITGAVAHRVELLVRADLQRWQDGKALLPLAFAEVLHTPLDMEIQA